MRIYPRRETTPIVDRSYSDAYETVTLLHPTRDEATRRIEARRLARLRAQHTPIVQAVR